MRAAAIRAATWRAAPAMRISSMVAVTRGTAIPVSVMATAMVKSSSVSVNPPSDRESLIVSSPARAVRNLPGPSPVRDSARRRRGRSRPDREVRLQFQETLFAEALDVHQLFDLLEAAVLLAVLEDALCRLGADAGQRFELG